LAAVQQYANAVNALNTTSLFISDGTDTSPPLYYTLLTQHANKNNTSSSCTKDPAKVLSTWHSLKIHCSASTSLLTTLTTTQNTLQLERIDVALAAADAKEKLAQVIASSPLAFLAIELEEFTKTVANQLKVLAMDMDPSADVIDAMHHLVLGYATVVLTAQDNAASPVGDGGGDGGSDSASWLMESLPWLSSAVQAADNIGSVCGEMQLIIPHLTSLLAGEKEQIAAVSERFSAIKEKLVNSSSSSEDDDEEEEVSKTIMAQLVGMSNTWPAVGSFLQCLHAVQSTTTSSAAALLASSGGGGGGGDDENSITAPGINTGAVLASLLPKRGAEDSPHWECLELAAAALDCWHDLLNVTGNGGGGGSSRIAPSSNILNDSKIDVLQESVKSTVFAAVAASVQLHFLPAVHAVMMRTAADLAERATKLPQTKSLVVEKKKNTPTLSTRLDTFGASMLPEIGGEYNVAAEFSAAAQGPSMPLPAFFDYLDDEDDSAGLRGLDNLGLEEGKDEESLEPVEQWEQLIVGEGSNDGDGKGLMEEEEEEEEEEHVVTSSATSPQLSTLISLCCEKSGALAAVDAVLHLTGTTNHQAKQQAQQAQIDLAAHQWIYEPVLLHSSNITAEDLKTALQQESNKTTGAPSTLLLPSPLELTLAALVTPRYEVLSTLKAAITTLQSTEEGIQKWENVAIPIEHLFSSELLRIAPTAGANIQVCIEAGHGWRNTAVMHLMHLKDALKSVVECENVKDSSVAEKKEEKHCDGGDGEEKIKFEKERAEYNLAIEHVHAALTTAQSSLTTHRQELDNLRKEVKTAAEKISKFENLSAAAVEQLSHVALPLVKATQKLPGILQTVQEYVTHVDRHIDVLSTMQRRLTRVYTATVSFSSFACGSGGGGDGSTRTGIASFEVQISSILENLSTSVDSLRSLPTVLQTLQYSVDAARRSLLLHGGRGVAAAREQAVGVIRQCKDAMEKLQPLVSSFILVILYYY
jgi:hypothetical protein